MKDDLLKYLKDQLNEAGKGFTQWLSMGSGVKTLINQLQKMPAEVIKVNSAMMELSRVSSASASDIKKYFDEAAAGAKKYGSSVSDMINAASDWSRRGYSLPDAKKLSEAAAIYSNISDGIDMGTANQFLSSTLRDFRLEAKDAMSVIDRFSAVAKRLPADTAGIGEALQGSASSFYAANTDLSKSIALIAGTNSVVQNPDSVGAMWETVNTRFGGESGSSLRNLIQGLTGFDIVSDESETQLKDIYDIIVGIGHEWQNLTNAEQSGLLEALSGKEQGNTLNAALNNISIIEEAYQTAENSAGSALAEQEKYEQGIEYSLQRLEAVFQTFSNNFLDSGFIKGVIDFGSSTISVIDKITSKIGSLGTVGLGAGLFAGIKNVGRDKMYSLICYLF